MVFSHCLRERVSSRTQQTSDPAATAAAVKTMMRCVVVFGLLLGELQFSSVAVTLSEKTKTAHSSATGISKPPPVEIGDVPPTADPPATGISEDTLEGEDSPDDENEVGAMPPTTGISEDVPDTDFGDIPSRFIKRPLHEADIGDMPPTSDPPAPGISEDILEEEEEESLDEVDEYEEDVFPTKISKRPLDEVDESGEDILPTKVSKRPLDKVDESGEDVLPTKISKHMPDFEHILPVAKPHYEECYDDFLDKPYEGRILQKVSGVKFPLPRWDWLMDGIAKGSQIMEDWNEMAIHHQASSHSETCTLEGLETTLQLKYKRAIADSGRKLSEQQKELVILLIKAMFKYRPQIFEQKTGFERFKQLSVRCDKNGDVWRYLESFEMWREEREEVCRQIMMTAIPSGHR